jgi:hypothetical protein
MKWILPEPGDGAAQLAAELQLDVLAARVLWARGLRTAADAAAFPIVCVISSLWTPAHRSRSLASGCSPACSRGALGHGGQTAALQLSGVPLGAE